MIYIVTLNIHLTLSIAKNYYFKFLLPLLNLMGIEHLEKMRNLTESIFESYIITMKYLFSSGVLIALGLGLITHGKKNNLKQLDFSNFKVSESDNLFSKSPAEIIDCFNLHAFPPTTVKIEIESNFIFESSLYELKLELIRKKSEEWELEEFEIEKNEYTSQEIYFSDQKMLEGPYSGYRNYYQSIANKSYKNYLKYQTKENKVRKTKERFLDLINDESRDKAKDGYSELEIIANTLPVKDPDISNVSRIEIEFDYLCEIKSIKGVMKVDFECLRQSDHPKIWVINESESYFKEF